MAAGLEWINGWLQPVRGGWPVLRLILLAGVSFTFRLGFFQTLWFLVEKNHGKFVLPKEADEDRCNISPFQALTTALAGSIGYRQHRRSCHGADLGGPGAIFWMWVSAGLGMMTIFCSANGVGLKYRQKDKQSRWLGWATNYLQYGFPRGWLWFLPEPVCRPPLVWAISAQFIGSSLQNTFGIPPLLTGRLQWLWLWFFCDLGNPFDAPHQNQSQNHCNHTSGQQWRNAKGVLQGTANGIGLSHIAHTKGGQHTGSGKNHSQPLGA